MTKKISKQGGFTLIEMIVSLGIFTVVALIAVGALLKVMDANRKSINLKTTINNINFALESMSREMRVGRDFYCGKGSTITAGSYEKSSEYCFQNGNWIIAFRSSKSFESCNLIYAYRSYGGKIQKAQQLGCKQNLIDASFKDLIAPNIKIDSSSIILDGKTYKKFFIKLSGYSQVKLKDRVDFTIQTSVSQRVI